MNAIFRDTEGRVIATPNARSFAAIRRAYNRAPPERTLGRDGMAMRAYLYVQWVRGEETTFREMLYRADKLCEFARASDGANRVRAVTLDGVRYEIPHWDFVASVENAD